MDFEIVKTWDWRNVATKCIQNDLFDSPGAYGPLDSKKEAGKPEDKEQLAEVRLTEVMITIWWIDQI